MAIKKSTNNFVSTNPSINRYAGNVVAPTPSYYQPPKPVSKPAPARTVSQNVSPPSGGGWQNMSGYAGWDPAAAAADFAATGGVGKAGAPSGGGAGESSGFQFPSVQAPTAESAIQSALKLAEFQRQQNQPAIQSLEASKTPLEERYQKLIAQIKGNQQVAENRQNVATRNELGRRGIIGGGLYEQSLTDALNPVTLSYAGLLNQAETGKTTDINDINAKIASLTAGNPQGSLETALSLAKLEQQAQSTNAENLSRIAVAQQNSQRLQSLGRYGSAYLDASGNISYIPGNYSSSGGSSGGGGDGGQQKTTVAERQRQTYLTQLQSDLKKNMTLGDVAFKYKGVLDPADLLSVYDQVSNYGPHKETTSQLQQLFGFK